MAMAGSCVKRIDIHNLQLAGLVMSTSGADDVSIGKFDMVATYIYAQARLNGKPETEAKRSEKPEH
jgi:hypothetical protein